LNVLPHQVIRAINDYSQQMNPVYKDNVHEAATGSPKLSEALQQENYGWYWHHPCAL